jgi:hypothetical protein
MKYWQQSTHKAVKSRTFFPGRNRVKCQPPFFVHGRYFRKHEGRERTRERPGKLSACMNYENITTTAVASVQPITDNQPGRVLKLGLDVHLLQHVVAMQYDGSSPKPPQRFTPKAFPAWVKKQMAAGWKIVSCCEAGPLGYGLHRELTALGMTNYVIRPRNWDDEPSGSKPTAPTPCPS